VFSIERSFLLHSLLSFRYSLSLIQKLSLAPVWRTGFPHHRDISFLNILILAISNLTAGQHINMQILHPLVLIALLTSTVDSAPARPKREGRSFKIPRVRRDNYVPHGPTALRKAHRKFGFGPNIPFYSSSSAVQTQSNAATNTEEGEVKASPQQGDVEFLSPVSVGGQTLMMDFDTGSSDL
jgi:hypothetical protein